MEIGKTLYITDRKDWRAWLEKNFRKEPEIWVIFPHKATGKPRISYNDAVEEALCFGWIDSTVKKYDENSSAQRFSPRNAGSSFSQQNKERIKWLYKKEKLHPSIIEEVQPLIEEEFEFPDDIIQTIQSNEKAWRNYQSFSPAYRRIRIAYIDSARKHPEEFKKRLEYFIKMTEKNKQIGYGGIEKYY